MSNITLSAGIRQNLLSLQNTAANLTTTQEHLSTGKKVNTAFDNPTSYFTSQSLNNRANDLGSLLDQIGQAQQTLDAANNGLTSLTSLLEQALSTAQQAQQTTPTAAGGDDRFGRADQPERRRQSADQCRRHHLHGRDHGERSAVFDRKPDQRRLRPRLQRRGDRERRRQRPSGADRQHQHHRVHRRRPMRSLRRSASPPAPRSTTPSRRSRPRAPRCRATTTTS